MHDIPAMILNRRMDVLAWNRGAAALLTDFGALAPAERNLIRLTFLDDAYRALYADWPRAARECVAVLRMEAGRHPKDQALAALIGELSLRDPDFRTWWADHRVRGRASSPRPTCTPSRAASPWTFSSSPSTRNRTSNWSPTPPHPTLLRGSTAFPPPVGGPSRPGERQSGHARQSPQEVIRRKASLNERRPDSNTSANHIP